LHNPLLPWSRFGITGNLSFSGKQENSLSICKTYIFSFVSLFTAGSPVHHELRNTRLEYTILISTCNNIWPGDDTIVNPGVNIGDRTIIGSGSVVAKDIPTNVINCWQLIKGETQITETDKSNFLEMLGNK
jgi:hypothetical protein